jgi:L-fuconolactonase
MLPSVSTRHPESDLVLDHLGKPQVGENLDQWRASVRAAAENPRLVAKVSGLYARGRRATYDDLAPVFDWAVECFGPERLMVGSDWPIAQVNGGLSGTWRILQRLIDSLPANAREAIRVGTATRVYGLALTT